MSLQVSGLTIRYDDAPLVTDLSLTVEAGQSAFLLGPSGVGKSSILRAIAGLLDPQAGRIVIDGDDLTGTPPHRRRIGMLFQEPALFPHLDALGNVAFGLPYRGLPRSRRHREALHWLDLVGLADRATQSVATMSGGQRQRVALARTLAAKPRAVLLDEPLSALDADLRIRLGRRVKALLAEQGVPALWVSHDEVEAKRLADVAWRLRDGLQTLRAKPQE